MSDFIYYNAPVICVKDDINSVDLPAVFADETVEPIIKNASDYEFALARYDMKIGTVPILDMEVVQNQSNINLLTYAIRIYGTVGSTDVDSEMINFVYVPRNNRADMQGYYFIYNYDHFCDIMNACFESCVSAVSSTAKAPKIVFSPSTTRFTIYVDDSAYDLSNVSNTEQLQIQFNQELFNLLRNFNYLFNSDNSANLIVSNNITNVIGSSPSYLFVEQNYVSTAMWTPIENIVFESTGMQLNNEIIGNTSFIRNAYSKDIIGSEKSNTEQNNITDIVINLNSSIEYNSNITYIPSVYRWINMYRISDLNKISFSVSWRHKKTKLKYPILMPNGASASLKLLFKKKYI